MKRIILPLIAATPFLTALVPHADAAAITRHHDSLNPRLIGAGKLHRRFNNGVPAPIFKTNQLVAASTASVEESLVNAILSGSLTLSSGSQAGALIVSGNGLTKSGSGTLTLRGANTYSGGEISAGRLTINTDPFPLTGGTLRADVNQSDFLRGFATTGSHGAIVIGNSGRGSIDINGANFNLGTGIVNAAGTGNLTIEGNGTLTINTGVVGTAVDQTLSGLNIDSGGVIDFGMSPISVPAGSIVAYSGITYADGDGTITILPGNCGSLNVGGFFNGTIRPNGSLVLNGGQTTSPVSSADPVPEPGTAVLFSLGMLAASQVRRRKI